MQRKEASPMIPCIKPFADVLEKSNHVVKETQEEEPQSGEARNPKQQTKNDLDEQEKSNIVQDEHKEQSQRDQEQNPKQQTKSDVETPVANEAVDFLPFRRSVVETDTSLE